MMLRVPPRIRLLASTSCTSCVEDERATCGPRLLTLLTALARRSRGSRPGSEPRHALQYVIVTPRSEIDLHAELRQARHHEALWLLQTWLYTRCDQQQRVHVQQVVQVRAGGDLHPAEPQIFAKRRST